MKTLALVIGNDEYFEGMKLANAVNDASEMAQIFERLGYDVISKFNCCASDYTDLLDKFEKRIEEYDASIFYFAGHGFEIEGENYLASIDCQVTSGNKYHSGQTCIRLSEVLTILKKHTQKVNIVIIDACRKSFDRSGNIGFSPIQAPKGTLLAFSTSPNEGASDSGFEGHSVFTGSILRFIGRERLSVEELFKKVRKTVYTLTEGRQTTWEHTSLIGDYYFNQGQLIHSILVSYDETVVKDVNYRSADAFGKLISEIKSYNWNIQNPAIDKVLTIPVANLDKNQQFILGRNLLQASGAAYQAEDFMKKIQENIKKYTVNNENHVLNGILFEIYFNSYGDFRKNRTKQHHFETIIALRKEPELESSFIFIRKLLESTNYPLIYLPQIEDELIDIEIVAINEKVSEFIRETTYQVISKITYNNIDFTKEIDEVLIYGLNENGLTQIIANYFSAPKELVKIHCGVKLEKVALAKKDNEGIEF